MLLAVRRVRREPLFWPKKMSLGDKLQRLALISPKDLRAIEIIVDDLLRRRWRKFKTAKSKIIPPPSASLSNGARRAGNGLRVKGGKR